MTQNPSDPPTDPLADSQVFAMYKSLSRKAQPLPLPSAAADAHQPGEDLLAIAEAAEAGGDFAFLNAPLEADHLAIPPSLLTRANALAPRQQARRAPRWRQALAGMLTVVFFGSGSYALAASLAPSDTAASWDAQASIFDSAADSGFLDFE